MRFLNTTRCGNILKSEMNTGTTFYKKMCHVKMSLTRGQSAWVKTPSETQRSAFSSNAKGTIYSPRFCKWLVGIVDGDGYFSFSINNKEKLTWTFEFAIAMSETNDKLAHFIKRQLEIGCINNSETAKKRIGKVPFREKATKYRVRKHEHLINYIIPIFNKYPFLTNLKYFQYSLFRKAIFTYLDTTLTREQKYVRILDLKSRFIGGVPDGYIHPVWSAFKNQPGNFKLKRGLFFKEKTSLKDIKKVMSKSWIVGFTEAEGSFYITRSDKQRNKYRHVFEYTQKITDTIVLEAIAIILKMNFKKKNTHYSIYTYKIESIENAIKYFGNTMKGRKSLEFADWCKSFRRRSRGSEYLAEMQQRLRNIRANKKNLNNLKMKV